MNFKKNLYVWTGSQTYVNLNCVVLSSFGKFKSQWENLKILDVWNIILGFDKSGPF